MKPLCSQMKTVYLQYYLSVVKYEQVNLQILNASIGYFIESIDLLVLCLKQASLFFSVFKLNTPN